MSVESDQKWRSSRRTDNGRTNIKGVRNDMFGHTHSVLDFDIDDHCEQSAIARNICIERRRSVTTNTVVTFGVSKSKLLLDPIGF